MNKQFARVSLALMATLSSAGAMATVGSWDSNRTPANGFGGLTDTWGNSASGSFRAEWNVFDSTTGDTTPDVGSFNVGYKIVKENTGSSFLTGGGNIYSFAGVQDFRVSTNPQGAAIFGTRTIVLKIGSLGTSLDFGTVFLDGVAPTSFTKVFTEAIAGGPTSGGNEEEWIIVWERVADKDGSYRFDFNPSDTSFSLDQLAVYGSPAAAAIPAVVNVTTFPNASIKPNNPDDEIRVIVFGSRTNVGDPVTLNTDNIKASTVRFGPEVAPIMSGSATYNIDNDSDGIEDARFSFRTGDTGIQCTDEQVTLSGELNNGDMFMGSDSDFACESGCH